MDESSDAELPKYQRPPRPKGREPIWTPAGGGRGLAPGEGRPDAASRQDRVARGNGSRRPRRRTPCARRAHLVAPPCPARTSLPRYALRAPRCPAMPCAHLVAPPASPACFIVAFQKRGTPVHHKDERASHQGAGGDLLFHTVARAVPSALEGLTSEFEMGSGGAPPL
jgi:hypothetical protein